jgi:hypothetical protein
MVEIPEMLLGMLINDDQTSEIYEPRHDKTNIVRLRPAWIQTSLRTRYFSFLKLNNYNLYIIRLRPERIFISRSVK